VELSHRIVPGKEHFKLVTRVEDVTRLHPQGKDRPDVWYPLGEPTSCTHAGTHLEVHFHPKKGRADIADFPFRQLIRLLSGSRFQA